MPLVDYHVHTPLCNHARGSMDAYVRRALDLGLAEICFLDHLTVGQDGRGLSMEPEEVALYYRAARRLGRRYAGQIQIKVGLEIDFNPSCVDFVKRITESYAFDVLGGSVHFLDRWNLVSRRSMGSSPFEGSEALVDRYLDEMGRMLENIFFDVICHLDVAKKFVAWGRPEEGEKMGGILRTIGASGLCVEVNTSGYGHPTGEAYPSRELLRQCRELGIGVTLGSDAHEPHEVGRDFARGAALLNEVGYRHLTTFTRRSPKQVELEA